MDTREKMLDVFLNFIRNNFLKVNIKKSECLKLSKTRHNIRIPGMKRRWM